MFYSKILCDSIEKEKAGIDYFYNEHDKTLLHLMLDEINQIHNTDYHYLAEVDALNLSGSGTVMSKYIWEFESQAVRAYLIPQIVEDRVDGCEKLLIELYKSFKVSNEYISGIGKPSPAHICTRYDNALKKLKPKRYTTELLQMIDSPRDIYYLPYTVQMLASWKIPKLKELLLFCVKDDGVTCEDVGLPNNNENYYPSLKTLNEQIPFIVINSLKYYPTDDTMELLKAFAESANKDLRICAEKAIAYVRKRDS